MALYHVTITGRDRRHLTELGTRYRVLVVGYRELAAGGVQVDAYVDSSKTKWLEKQGYKVTRIEEVEHRARQRQAEGRTAAARRTPARSLRRCGLGRWLPHGGRDRTGDGSRRGTPQGLRRADHPPPSDMGETALPCLADRQGPRTSAARDLLHRRRARTRVGQCGHPRLLRHSAAQGLSRQRGHSCRQQRYSRSQIREIIEKKDVFLFPQVNPDGRRFSMEQQPMWRKNRRPAPRGRAARSIGVDLNRNFPMMWRFDRHFAPGTVESSHLPSDFETYVGPRPASEPETRNVIWLLDRYPQIGTSSTCTRMARRSFTAGAPTKTSRTMPR